MRALITGWRLIEDGRLSFFSEIVHYHDHFLNTLPACKKRHKPFIDVNS